MIRTANQQDAEQIAQVHIDSWHTTYRGIVKQEILDQLDVQKRTQLWQMILQEPDHYILVSTDEHEHIVGFVDSYFPSDEPTGEINAFYLLQDAQGQGLGTKLLNQVMKYAKQNGYSELRLEVFNQNPSCQFYEKKGAICVDEQDASDYAPNLKSLIYTLEVL